MANIIDYTRNVAKSITYSAVDKIKDMNPVLVDLAESNQDLTKTLYSAIKDYKGTMKKAKDWVIKSDVYEAADVGLHAVVEDIRSGKFYNRERMDELETKSGGQLTNGWGDFSDDPFAEIDNSEDGNFGFDDSDDEISKDTLVIHDSIDNTGDKITNGIAMATARSAEGIASTNIKIAQKNQKHNEFLANKISANMGAINSTVAELIRFNTEQQKPYIDKSISFYNDIMNAHKETNELLKKIISNQEQMISPPDEKKNREDLGWNAIGDVPDLAVYGKRIAKNIKDMSGGILDFFDSEQNGGMGNLLLDFVSSPLKAIPDMIVKSVVPKAVENITNSLNDTIAGSFGAIVHKFNKLADDDSILSYIGKALGIQEAENFRTTPNTSAVGKKAIAWDAEAKQALTRVIPDTLAKILSAQTQTMEKYFDYSRGEYVDADILAKRHDSKRVKQEAADSALRDIIEPIKELVATVDFGEDAELLKGVKDGIDQLSMALFSGNTVFNPKNIQKMVRDEDRELKLADYVGLTGISDDAQQYILGAISTLAQVNEEAQAANSEKMNELADQFMLGIKMLQANRLTANTRQKDAIERMSKDPTSVAMNLYNGLGDFTGIYDDRGEMIPLKKNGKYTEEQMKIGKLNPLRNTALSQLQVQHDTYALLEEIYKQVASINQNGIDITGGSIPPGGGNDYRRNHITPNGIQPRRSRRNASSEIEVPITPQFRRAYDKENRREVYGQMYEHNERVERDIEKDLESHNRTAARITHDNNGVLTKADDIKAKVDAMQDNLAGGEGMPGSSSDNKTDTRKAFNAIEGSFKAHLNADTENKRLTEIREKQRKKDEFYDFMGITPPDFKSGGILEGIRELSNKPAEFLGNIIHKVDERLYQVIYGDENDDKMAPKAFMNQLTARMGYVFRNFTDVMKDEVFDPIKDTLFGNKKEDGLLNEFGSKLKSSLGLDDDFKMDEAIAKFIFGKKDENGNRHGGMFGDKIQWTKDTMKDTYNDLFDYLIPAPESGKYEVDHARYNKAFIDKKQSVNKRLRSAIKSDYNTIDDNYDYIVQKLKEAGYDTETFMESEDFKTLHDNSSDKYGDLQLTDPDKYNKFIARDLLKGTDLVRKSGVLDQADFIKVRENLIENDNELANTADDLTNSLKRLNGEIMDLYSSDTIIKNKYSTDDILNENFSTEDAESLRSISRSIGSKKQQSRELKNNLSKVNHKRKVASETMIKRALANGDENTIGWLIQNGYSDALVRHGYNDIDYINSIKDTDEYKNSGVTERLARGGEVKKTGLVALSKGEFVIPNKFNLNYKGNKDTKFNLKKEQSAIDKYLKAGNINLGKNGLPTTYKGIKQLATGGYTGNGTNPGEAVIEETNVNEDNLDPEAFRDSKLKRLTNSLTDSITTHSRNFRADRKRKKNFKKLTPEQQKLIEDFGYDGDYDNLTASQQSMYDDGDFIGVLRSMGRLEEGIQAAADDMDADKYEENKEKLFNGMINDLKDNMGAYFPSALGSSLIGAGVSLVTGAVGGPLLGAAIGAGVDIAAHSEKVKDWLFGELDEDGNRKGNIISADIANNVKKYFPSIAKGATVGAITSILPFVPGGPVSGIIVGSALGFAKKSDTIQNFLFGHMNEDGEFERGILPQDFKQKLQGVVPDAVLGMLGGAVGGTLLGGPFGLVGNMAVGGAVGILASMGTFQDALFGKKDPSTGVREGGLLGTIKTGFVDPMIETGKDLKDRFVEWFKKDIAHPLTEAIAPLAKQGGLFINKIMNGVSSAVGGVVAHELGSNWAGLGHLFQSVTKKVAGGTVALGSAMMHPIGSMVSAPARMIGNVGEHFKRNQVADGNADYLTAKQRLQYRQELDDGVYYKKYTKNETDEKGNIIHRKGDVMVDELGRPIKDNYNRRFRYFHNTLGRGKMKKHGKHADKFETFDKMLMDMDEKQLTSLNESLEYLKNPDKVSQRQRNKAVDAINSEVHNKYGFGYRQSQKLLGILREKGMPAAVQYVQKQNLDAQSEKELITFLQQKYSEYQMADYTLDQKKTMKNKAYKELDKMGLKGINQDNIDKYIKYTQQEIGVKKKTPVEQLNDDQAKRHQEIVNYFKDTVDLLKAMADRGNKDKYLQNIAKRNKVYGERKRHQTFFGDTLGRNTGALWGPNYDSEPVYNESTGDYDWYYVNKETGERYQVDAHGNRVDGEPIPDDAAQYTSTSKYNPISAKLHQGADAIKNSAAYKFAWTKVGKNKKAYQQYKQDKFNENSAKRDEKIFKPLCIKLMKEKGGFKSNPAQDLEQIMEENNISTYEETYEFINKMETGNEALNDSNAGVMSAKLREKFYRGKLDNLGLKSSRLYTGIGLGRKYKFRDKKNRNITAESYYNNLTNDGEENPELNGEGTIVGEEQDVLNKRKTVFDLFGNPIKVIKSRDGRWVKDPADSENKEAGVMQNMLTGLGDRLGGILGGIGSDIKDGFAHMFNIDTERDGWLKTLLKVGGGILGVLTAASAIPAAKAWWDDNVKPQVREFFDGHSSKIGKLLEPIAPTIIRGAVGIDLAIRSIPSKIEELGQNVRGFIVNDLPAIWKEKIIPFYAKGFEFLGSASSWITENLLKGAINILPRIISGAIKGAAKFFTRDIYSMIFNNGKRDTNSMSSQSSFDINTKSVNTRISDLKFDTENFSGTTDLASKVFGQDMVNKVMGQSELEKYYTKGGPYPQDETSSSVNTKASSTGEGDSNTSYDQEVTNYASQTNKSINNIQSLYKVADSNTDKTAALPTTDVQSYQPGMTTGSVVGNGKNKSSYKSLGYKAKSKTAGNGSKIYIGGASGIAYNETELGDPMSGYHDMDQTYQDSMAWEQQMAAEQSNPTVTSAITSINDNSNVSGFDLNDENVVQSLLDVSVNSIKNTTDVNGIPCYDASTMFKSGSSAGITLYKATYDPNTGLIYSQTGKFIPNAYYDPASGLITATPTTECIQTYPNIATDHYNAFRQALASGALTYRDIAGDAYDSNQDPNYIQNTWIDENGSIKGTMETVSEDLQQTGKYVSQYRNENTLGGRLFGISSLNDNQINPTGLVRSAITGNTGVVGKTLKGLATKPKSDARFFSKVFGGARAAVFSGPSKALNYTNKHSLKSAAQNINKTGTFTERLIKKNIGGAKTGSEVTGNLFKKAVSLNDSAGSKVWNAVKESSDEFATGGKFTKTLVTKLKSVVNDIIESKACRKILKNVGVDGVETTLKEAAEKGSDDIARLLVQKAAKTGVGKTIKTICHYIPYVDVLFWINDFVDGVKYAATYLGISEDQLKTTFPGYHWVVKIICGLANVLNGQFLLGIIPMTSIVDIFLNYVAPVLGIDTTKLQAAREEMTQTVDEFNQKNGTNFDETQYNKYMASDKGNNTSWSGWWASKMPWTETYKLTHQVTNSQNKAREAAYVSNSTSNASKINSLTKTDISDIMKNYGSGSSLDLGNNTVYIGGGSKTLHLSNTYESMNYDNTANLAKALAKSTPNPMFTGVKGSGTRFVASGSGLSNGVRFINNEYYPSSSYSVSGGVSLARPTFTSLGTMDTIAKATAGSSARFVGAGSGIAGRGSGLGQNYTVYYSAGASKKKSKNKKKQTVSNMGTEIVSIVANFILTTVGHSDIGYMQIESGSKYTIGIGSWQNNKAAALLKKIASKNANAAKQIVGDKVYKKLTTSKTCNESDYTSAQVLSIKKLLSTEESRQIQLDYLVSDVKSAIQSASKLYSDPKVVAFAAVIAYDDDAKHLPKKSKDIGISEFYKAFKSTSAYKKNSSRYDSVFDQLKDMEIASVDTSKVDTNSIAQNIGIKTSNTTKGSKGSSGSSSSYSSEGSSSSGESEHSGNWISDLQDAISNMGNALFGIGRKSTDDDSSSSSSDSDADSSTLGQELSAEDQTAQEITEQLSVHVEDFNNYAYTLRQRLNSLEKAFNIEPSSTTDSFSNSALLSLLIGSEWFQKWAHKQNTKPISGSGKSADNELTKRYNLGADIASTTDADVNKTDTSEESVDADIQAAADANGNVSYKTSNGQMKKLTVNDIFVSSVIANKDRIAKKVGRDYASICSGDKVMDSFDNFKAAFLAFINTYACSSITAKKTRFYKEILINNKSLFKKIKAKWSDRVAEIDLLMRYSDGDQIENDFKNDKFYSKSDLLTITLESAMKTLSTSTDTTYAEQEAAWDAATGAMQELLGVKGPLTSTTIKNKSSKNNKLATEGIPSSVYEAQRAQGFKDTREQITKSDPLTRFRNVFKKNSKGKKKAKKNEGVKLVTDILDAYPSVHDFDSIRADKANRNVATDIMGVFKYASQYSDKPKEVLMADLANKAESKNNIETSAYDKSIQKNKESIAAGLKRLSDSELSTYNVYNPYTIKRMIRTNQINSLLKTDEGKYYKQVSDDILTNYIYNHPMDSYSSGIRADGINGYFGKMLAKSPKNDVGFSSFEDFYTAYKDSIRSDLLNKQKYSSKYLKIDDNVQKSLPKLPNEIKISGTDIDNDSYVYADALYQTLINKNKKGKDVYDQLDIFGKDAKAGNIKSTKKTLNDSLKNYLKFESRKLAAVYYTGSDKDLANKISANSKKRNSNTVNEMDMTPAQALATSQVDNNLDSHASVIQRLLPVDDNFKTNNIKLDKILKSRVYIKNNDLGTLYAADHKEELQNKIKEMAYNIMGDISSGTSSIPNSMNKSSDGILVKDANSKGKKIDPSAIKIKINDNGSISVPHGAEYVDIKSTSDLANIAIGSGYTDEQYLTAIKEYCESNGYTLNTSNGAFKAVKAGAGSRIQDMVAGATNGFVSQLDYKNMKFADGESMAEAGCGPAVAAMALNGLQGGASMVDTAPLANKYKVQGGTDANYFRDIMSRNGVGTKYYEGSKAKAGVTDALKKGQQAVILGQDSSNRSKANSPFGPGNHYVLAKGMGGGKVAINDPEQHGTKLYDKKILKNAKLGIAIQGKGSGVIHKALKDKTGFIGGASYSQSLKHANLGIWSKLSASELRKAVENYHRGACKISKNAQIFLDAADASGLDPRFLVAIAAQETGWDSNANACGRANNVFDIAAYDSNPFNKDSTGTYGAPTYREGVCKGAIWIAEHYYKRGQTTIYLMRHNNGSHEYCTSTTWEDKIAQIMSRMPENTKVSFDSKSVKLDAKGYTSTGGSDNSSSSSSSGSTWQDQLVDAVNGMSDAMFGMVTGGEADGLSNSSSEGSASGESNGTWVSTVEAVKKAMCHASGGKYSQTAKCNITINGKSFSARTDCTGFVSACLKAFGSDIGSPDSYTFTRGINIKGFTKMKWPGWDKLIKGDIMARNGHAEIFSHNEGGKHKVWNFGGKYSAPYEGVTGSSHDSYTVIYRCNSNKGKGSGISSYDVIRSTRKKISASGNRGKGSGIHSASKMNEIALQKISKAYSSNNKKNSYSTQNIQKVNKSMTGKGSYKAGTTFAQVMSSAQSGAGYTHKNETVTMFHPETGAVIDVPYAAAGSAMDLGYVAGATKVKGVRSKKKVTTGNNLANTNMLIKTVIQLLASIDKSEKKNTEIVAVLRKLYTLQQQQSSESSSKKKKKGKGSELYGGDSEADENTVISSTTPSTSTSSRSVNSSSSTTSTITEEDDSITGLINSLMNIIVD